MNQLSHVDSDEITKPLARLLLNEPGASVQYITEN